jgi:hypothetical protein
VIREGCKSSVASQARAAAQGSSGAGNFRPGSAGAGKRVNLTGGAWLTERRGRGGWFGMA